MLPPAIVPSKAEADGPKSPGSAAAVQLAPAVKCSASGEVVSDANIEMRARPGRWFQGGPRAQVPRSRGECWCRTRRRKGPSGGGVGRVHRSEGARAEPLGGPC
eukprot:10317623-Alexandrium_andersonii.AAC.1